MKRLGQVDDLFGPVIFLASESSNFVNGHILVVDGGVGLHSRFAKVKGWD